MAESDNQNVVTSVAREGDRLVVRLQGHLNHERSAEAQVELIQLVAKHRPRALVLDLAGVSHIDSSGIALLLVARRRMGSEAGGVKLVGVSPLIRELLKAVKLESLFTIVESEEGADG